MRYSKVIGNLERQHDNIESEHLRMKVSYEKLLRTKKAHSFQHKTIDRKRDRMILLKESYTHLDKAIESAKKAYAS